MPKFTAITIGQVTGGMSTDDGGHVLVRTQSAPGTEMTLAVACDQIDKLIDLLALGKMQCRRVNSVPVAFREVYTTTWWELAFDATTKMTVLSLTFGLGGRLDFSLPGMMPSGMLEALQVHLEKVNMDKPGKRLN